MSTPVNGEYELTFNAAVRAFVAAFSCFVVFVCICYFFTIEDSATAGGLVMRAPDDWYNGARVAVAALLASALSTLIYRRPHSRPMAIAIALGLIFLSIDLPAIWQQAQEMVRILPKAPLGIRKSIPDFDQAGWEKMRFDAIVHLARIYWVYYLAYILWTVIALYAGYLGQYLIGLAIMKREARKESAVYLAENAGVGLFASISAGIIAMAVAAWLSTFTAPSIRLLTPLPAPAAPAAKETPAAKLPLSPGGPSKQAQNPRASALPASVNMVKSLEAEDLEPRYPSSSDLRVRLFIIALAFFVTAYISALSFRPRTSTWVACGAIVGVMVLPLLAAKWPLRGTPFFTILGLSPFALAGMAVASSLAGDWVARLLLARTTTLKPETYKPL